MYTLNGLGPKGSVRGGKPSEARHLLLRREALELALYTFRYVKNVNLVVALLPPKPPAKTKNKDGSTTTSTADPQTQALFYRPGDLEPQLEIPLNATIPAKTPRPETIPPAESRRIDALTRGNLFPRLLPAGAEPEGVPRAGPPAPLARARLVAAAFEHRHARVLRVLRLGLGALAEREL